MTTAKLFKHGGSQAVRLPKVFRFPGSEVLVERRGEEVVLRAKPGPELKTLRAVARHMVRLGGSFPDREPPTDEQRRDLTW